MEQLAVSITSKEGTVVTRDEAQEIETTAGQIKVMPAWKYFLAE